MKYSLYKADDKRDGNTLLWLVDVTNDRVATFCTKWAPSRIKQNTAAAPGRIVWSPLDFFVDYANHDDMILIDEWGFAV